VTNPFHHGSHRALLSRPELLPSGEERVDAIIVPSARSAPYLRGAASLAQRLNCTLVVLSSKHSRRPEVVADIGKHFVALDLVAIAMPASLGPPVPVFETSRILAGTPFERRTDTSAKRNLGLLLARTVGWRQVVFLDDDIAVPDPEHLRRAAKLLEIHDGVGLSIGGYPDNSVVCHAYRNAGGWQETFVGGGALAVPAQRIDSFFPNIYNEDWFFLLDDAKLRPVAEVGKALQHPYDPFAHPDRARGQEFGDVLAEGLFALLDRGGRVQDADERYWTKFLPKRARFIAEVLAGIDKADLEPGERRRMTESLKAARGRLRLITPRLCVDYLQAWRADCERWRGCLAELPRNMSIREVLRHLDLGGRFTIRSAGQAPGQLSVQIGRSATATAPVR
jgi:glycosyltransferase involved in cell wall biosynthesis